MLYELAADPLGDSADPRRYVPVGTHERALEALSAGIREGRSPVLLIGVGGVGKTLLLRVLAQRERRSGHLAVFSPFLHLAPGDVAPWLLYLLGGRTSCESGPDAALLAALRFYAAPPMVIFVDEIQSAPEPSVERLTELVRAGGSRLSLVVAGAPGSSLEALLPVLAPKTTFELPDALLPDELNALCDAILRHPQLEPELRALSPREREALLQAASGVPAMLKNALVRRAVHASLGLPLPEIEPRRATPRAVEPLALPETSWPAWPAPEEHEVAPKREPRPGFARWPRRPAGEPIDLERAALARSEPAPAKPEPELVRVSPLGRRRDALLHRAVQTARSAAAAAARIVEQTRPVAAGLARDALWRARASGEWAASSTAPGRERLARASMSLALATRRRLAAWTLATRTRLPLLRAELDGGRVRLERTTRRLAVQASRLPRPPLAAAAALAIVALLPLHDAGRVDLAAPAPAVSSAPPGAVATPRAPAPAVASRAAPPAPKAAAAPRIRVQVNAHPWARVRVDGVDAGSTPLSHLHLAPGVHDFVAEFPDGRVLRRRIEIGPERRFVSFP